MIQSKRVIGTGVLADPNSTLAAPKRMKTNGGGAAGTHLNRPNKFHRADTAFVQSVRLDGAERAAGAALGRIGGRGMLRVVAVAARAVVARVARGGLHEQRCRLRQHETGRAVVHRQNGWDGCDPPQRCEERRVRSGARGPPTRTSTKADGGAAAGSSSRVDAPAQGGNASALEWHGISHAPLSTTATPPGVSDRGAVASQSTPGVDVGSDDPSGVRGGRCASRLAPGAAARTTALFVDAAEQSSLAVVTARLRAASSASVGTRTTQTQRLFVSFVGSLSSRGAKKHVNEQWLG